MHHNTNAHVNANMEQILKQETAPVAKRKRENNVRTPKGKETTAQWKIITQLL